MEEIVRKKKKVEVPGEFKINLHASVLTQAFFIRDGKAEVWVYGFQEIKGFGVMLPVRFEPMPLWMCEGNVMKISLEKIRMLKKFQNALWSEFFQVSCVETEDVSTANYLVFPVKHKKINWTAVKIALNLLPPKVISSIPETRLPKCIITCAKPKLNHYFIARVTKKTDLKYLLQNLPKKSLYSQQLPDEIEEKIIEKTEKLIDSSIFDRLPEGFSFILCRMVKIVRRNPSPTIKLNPNLLKLVPESSFTVFYLTREQYRSGMKLIKLLIDIERYSHLVEFSTKFEYKGEFCFIRDATTAPALDNSKNYDSLENLGDSILKVLSSLHVFYKHPKANEGYLTDTRTSYIKNDNLFRISLKNELYFYIRSSKFKHKWFRPAFYCNPIESCGRAFSIERLSNGTLADLVESLIGAFFSSGGFLAAAKYINQLGMFSSQSWKKVLKFCGSQYIHILSPADLKKFTYSGFKSLIPQPKSLRIKKKLNYDSLEKRLGYKFTDIKLLQEAFTHTSLSEYYNYERLEFLGDAVLDAIVVSNMHFMGNFTANNLTMFRHMLVNNNILAKLAIHLKLYNYLHAAPEVKASVQDYLQEIQWEEDLLEFGVYNSDPPKCLNDIFEALLAAIVIDSQSLDFACALFTPLMKNLMIHLANNPEKCSMNVRSKLSVHCQRTRSKMVTLTRCEGDSVCAEVIINGKSICEKWAKTSWLAKQLASEAACEILMCNI